MTQTPQLPPTQPPEPLDASERDIARALRNLPAGLPPPELDARILGAARRAVHLAQPRKRNRGWLIGLGTAASALLAIGVMYRTHSPADSAFFQPKAQIQDAASAQQAAPAAAPAEADKAMNQGAPAKPADAIGGVEPPPPPPPPNTVEAPMEARRDAPAGDAQMAPERIVPQQPADGLLQSSQSHAAAPKQVPNAFPTAPAALAGKPTSTLRPAPTPPAPPVLMEEPAPVSAQVQEPSSMAPPPPPSPPAPAPSMDVRSERKTESGFAARQNEKDQGAATSAPAAAGAAANQPALGDDDTRAQSLKKSAASPAAANAASSIWTGDEKAKSLDRAKAAGGRITSTGSEDEDYENKEKLPSIEADERLAPSKWLERIRFRMEADDTDDARESLRRFHARYPDSNIPEDLRPLLQ